MVKLKPNRHGNLAFQIRFASWKKWLGTPERDTPAARRKLEPLCTVIEYELNRGKKLRDIIREHFSYNPAGDMPDEAPTTLVADMPRQISTFGDQWMKLQNPPLITAAFAKVRRCLVEKYVLPRWGTQSFADVSSHALAIWRAELLEQGLSLSYVSGIITGHFGALYRDARAAAKSSARRLGVDVPAWTLDSPFTDLTWKSMNAAEPDPFSDADKAALLGYFRERHPHWYPFVLWQFEVGTRPSEATALRVLDVDLAAGAAHIRRSRVGRVEGISNKTTESQRLTLIWPWVQAELLTLGFGADRPPMDYFFRTQTGKPVAQETFRAVFWGEALRALSIRDRRFYCTRHTAISGSLSAGERSAWVAENFGTSIEIIERHYLKYIGRTGGSALIAARSNLNQTSPVIEEKVAQQRAEVI